MSRPRNLGELVDRIELRLSGSFYGKYEGVVTDTADPLEIGRLRARVPAVLGEDTETGWALPCAPFGGGKDRGLLFLPETGDTVWIEFAAGDVTRPIWSGVFWGAPESSGQQDDLGTASGSELPEVEGKRAGPGHLVLKTRAGHRLVLDDDGELLILANGNDKTEIRLTRSGEVVVTAEKIKLGSSASEPLVLGDAFRTLFNSHTHPTGVGPSGPPVQPMTPAQLSRKSSTE
ncbi:MAG TPA: phage baseplate assembly protein V [Thermoanaerobaculia bacterium]|nr:phage baseplate assembly protein V [Thermoanaerobaculia bacterium]